MAIHLHDLALLMCESAAAGAAVQYAITKTRVKLRRTEGAGRIATGVVTGRIASKLSEGAIRGATDTLRAIRMAAEDMADAEKRIDASKGKP